MIFRIRKYSVNYPTQGTDELFDAKTREIDLALLAV